MTRRPEAVYVDVDDTLVRSFGPKRIPISATIAKVRELSRSGCQLYLWSSGGAEYCREVAEELGIAECFAGFLPKPRVLIDDQPVENWEPMRWVHTNRAGSSTVEEILADDVPQPPVSGD